MAQQIFLNLPVKDLNKSIDFFQSLGFSFNPKFTDETAACLLIGENIFAMLLTHAKFKDFSPLDICDTSKANEILIAINRESREDVVAFVQKALASGAQRYSEPKDYGFMLQDAFMDLDGHKWEVFFMDESAFPA